MRASIKKHWKFWLFVGILFILPLLISAQNIEALKSFISEDNKPLAVLTIFIILVLTTAIAPLSSFALVPFASLVLGWQIVFITSVLAWTIGATIAFLIARKWGAPALRALGILDEVMAFTSKVPEEKVFTGIILLRILIPVDILSYAIGFVSNIPLWKYVLATAIGVIPGSFIWSYIGVAAFSGQLYLTGGIILVTALIAFFAFYFFKSVKRAKK